MRAGIGGEQGAPDACSPQLPVPAPHAVWQRVTAMEDMKRVVGYGNATYTLARRK